jgi:hypothetical protein
LQFVPPPTHPDLFTPDEAAASLSAAENVRLAYSTVSASRSFKSVNAVASRLSSMTFTPSPAPLSTELTSFTTKSFKSLGI